MKINNLIVGAKVRKKHSKLIWNISHISENYIGVNGYFKKKVWMLVDGKHILDKRKTKNKLQRIKIRRKVFEKKWERINENK